MKLIVDRDDLLPEYESMNCSQVALEHFKPDVQRAINASGGATFREYNRIMVDGAEPDEPVRRSEKPVCGMLNGIDENGDTVCGSENVVAIFDKGKKSEMYVCPDCARECHPTRLTQIT